MGLEFTVYEQTLNRRVLAASSSPCSAACQASYCLLVGNEGVETWKLLFEVQDLELGFKASEFGDMRMEKDKETIALLLVVIQGLLLASIPPLPGTLNPKLP